MKIFAGLAAVALMAAPAWCAVPPPPITQAKVLPLALDDHFQFRKTEMFLNDSRIYKPTQDPMIQFERQRVNYGAITTVDRLERRGQYFTFFWRAARPAAITVRLEYRQENLGGHVQAREVRYDEARGSMTTKFQIIGDDYAEDGQVTAWRALLIEDGKIVGLTQSYLWN